VTSPIRLKPRGAAEVANSSSFAEALEAGIYQGYAYSYPHKTSYRWFDEPQSLEQHWAGVDLSNTFLYAHIPFCEMRCGFCNLFTTTDSSGDRETLFVEALERQARMVRNLLGSSLRVTTGAIGGGTPTILSADNLHRVLSALSSTYNVDLSAVPFSVETSPDTADAEKIRILAEAGVHRASIGIQSWKAEELRAMGRPQDVQRAHEAVARLRESAIAMLNIDLIYGVEGQSAESMRANIADTLRHEPDEVFLYPLYVRPLTGLGRNTLRSWDDERLELYRVGRDVLLEAGYGQVSMRRFEKATAAIEAASRSVAVGESYDCQRDPTVGLGPGARSYTPNVHYSTDWAVGRDGVRSIIDSFNTADDTHHQSAHYGVLLNDDDRKRRFVMQGLLHETGVDLLRYEGQFGEAVLQDFEQLTELISFGAAVHDPAKGTVRLTDRGVELSDAIGPWLYSAETKARMASFEIR
jgi:oxygen-independent coproporphyrinogen III oxidase